MVEQQDFVDLFQVDQVLSVAAHQRGPFFQHLEREVGTELALRQDDLHPAKVGADMFHLARVHQFDSMPADAGDAGDGRGLDAGPFQRLSQGVQLVEGLFQPLPRDRFQQVVQGLFLQRLQHILVKGGDKDHLRHDLAVDHGQQLEAAQHRHLDVQEE